MYSCVCSEKNFYFITLETQSKLYVKNLGNFPKHKINNKKKQKLVKLKL